MLRAAAIPRVAPADRPDFPRRLPRVSPPDLPWLGLLLPLTRPKYPVVSLHRTPAAHAFENRSARTPASGLFPCRLPARAPALRQSSTQIRSLSVRDRRRKSEDIRRGSSNPRPRRPSAPATHALPPATTPCAWPDAPSPARAAGAARHTRSRDRTASP